MTFKYQTGSVLEYTVKMKKLLKIRKEINTATLINFKLYIGQSRQKIWESWKIWTFCGKNRFGDKNTNKLENIKTVSPCKHSQTNNKVTQFHAEHE